jgi:hypothetical protein
MNVYTDRLKNTIFLTRNYKIVQPPEILRLDMANKSNNRKIKAEIYRTKDVVLTNIVTGHNNINKTEQEAYIVIKNTTKCALLPQWMEWCGHLRTARSVNKRPTPTQSYVTRTVPILSCF